jgi:hydroxylamine reductase (hybrid-cluster protein)
MFRCVCVCVSPCVCECVQVGNFGGAWQLQKLEFSNFPGAILLTSNCLVEPRPAYRDRIFTTNAVGYARHTRSHSIRNMHTFHTSSRDLTRV